MFNVTVAGETYFVAANGDISRPMIKHSASGQWKLLGIVRRNNFGTVAEYIPFAQIAARLPSLKWTYANGKPIWTGRDLDHGTTREWGGGIYSITLCREEATNDTI